MKLCPLGHENADDAARCVVCLRRFGAPGASVELTDLPVGPVAVEPGRLTAVTLRLLQRGGEPAEYRVEVDGDAGPWIEPSPATLTLHADEPRQVVLGIQVPADAPAGTRVAGVTARADPDHDPSSARAEVHLDVRGAQVPPDPAPRPPVDDADDDPVTQVIHPAPAPVPPPPPVPPPAPVEPGHRRRLRPAEAVTALVLAAVVVVVLVLSGRDGGGTGGGGGGGGGADLPTPAQALALPSADARAVLDELAARDLPRLDALLGQGGFVVQLSSKCAVLEQADLVSAAGLGVPDGQEESFPGGLGHNGVLAFHLATVQRFGSSVVLADGGRLGRPPCDDGAPVWVTVDAPGGTTAPTVGAALCECRTRGLPFRECGATPTDGTTPVFWIPENEGLACT